MRNVNLNVLSAGDSLTTAGSQIDANQLISASFHAYFGDVNAAGTIKLQVSNDICNNRYEAANFVVSHWTDLPNQSANIVSGASALLTVANMTYRWIRAVYTSTATGVQTIAPVADVAGSLASKYFLINSANNANQYYVWMDVDGTSPDPAVPGKTGIDVVIATGDSAATIGAAIASALTAVASGADFSASGTTTVTVSNAASGPFTPASAGNSGFTVAITAGGTTTVNVNLNALGV